MLGPAAVITPPGAPGISAMGRVGPRVSSWRATAAGNARIWRSDGWMLSVLSRPHTQCGPNAPGGRSTDSPHCHEPLSAHLQLLALLLREAGGHQRAHGGQAGLQRARGRTISRGLLLNLRVEGRRGTPGCGGAR
jgi:hypothetical protein